MTVRTITKIDDNETRELPPPMYTSRIVVEHKPQEIYEEERKEEIRYQQHCLKTMEDTLERFRGVDTYSLRLIFSRYLDCGEAGVQKEATELLRKYDRVPALPETQRALLAA